GRIIVDHRQRMTAADEFVGDHGADGWVATAAVPIGEDAVGLVQAGARFEGGVDPEIVGQQSGASCRSAGQDQESSQTEQAESGFHGFSCLISTAVRPAWCRMAGLKDSAVN